MLGAGWLPGRAQRGPAGGRTRAGTCTPASPCCGAADVGVGGSGPPRAAGGAVLGAGWPPGRSQRGSAGGRTRAGTCTPASPCCGAVDAGAGGSEPPRAAGGAVLGAGWPPGRSQRGSAGGRTRAGTCTPALPCCGAADVGVGGSGPPRATGGTVLGGGVAAGVRAEGLSRGPHQGWHLHACLALLRHRGCRGRGQRAIPVRPEVRRWDRGGHQGVHRGARQEAAPGPAPAHLPRPSVGLGGHHSPVLTAVTSSCCALALTGCCRTQLGQEFC